MPFFEALKRSKICLQPSPGAVATLHGANTILRRGSHEAQALSHGPRETMVSLRSSLLLAAVVLAAAASADTAAVTASARHTHGPYWRPSLHPRCVCL